MNALIEKTFMAAEVLPCEDEYKIETVVTDRKCEECNGRIILTYSDFVCEDCGLVLGPRTEGHKYMEPIPKEKRKNGTKN